MAIATHIMAHLGDSTVAAPSTSLSYAGIAGAGASDSGSNSSQSSQHTHTNRWAGSSAGGAYPHSPWWQNPQYRLVVAGRTATVTVTLSQTQSCADVSAVHPHQADNSQLLSIGLTVVRLGAASLRALASAAATGAALRLLSLQDDDQVVLCGPFQRARATAAVVAVSSAPLSAATALAMATAASSSAEMPDENSITVLIIPSTDAAGGEAEFSLEVRCNTASTWHTPASAPLDDVKRDSRSSAGIDQTADTSECAETLVAGGSVSTVAGSSLPTPVPMPYGSESLDELIALIHALLGDDGFRAFKQQSSRYRKEQIGVAIYHQFLASLFAADVLERVVVPLVTQLLQGDRAALAAALIAHHRASVDLSAAAAVHSDAEEAGAAVSAVVQSVRDSAAAHDADATAGAIEANALPTDIGVSVVAPADAVASFSDADAGAEVRAEVKVGDSEPTLASDKTAELKHENPSVHVADSPSVTLLSANESPEPQISLNAEHEKADVVLVSAPIIVSANDDGVKPVIEARPVDIEPLVAAAEACIDATLKSHTAEDCSVLPAAGPIVDMQAPVEAERTAPHAADSVAHEVEPVSEADLVSMSFSERVSTAPPYALGVLLLNVLLQLSPPLILIDEFTLISPLSLFESIFSHHIVCAQSLRHARASASLSERRRGGVRAAACADQRVSPPPRVGRQVCARLCSRAGDRRCTRVLGRRFRGRDSRRRATRRICARICMLSLMHALRACAAWTWFVFACVSTRGTAFCVLCLKSVVQCCMIMNLNATFYPYSFSPIGLMLISRKLFRVWTRPLLQRPRRLLLIHQMPRWRPHRC